MADDNPAPIPERKMTKRERKAATKQHKAMARKQRLDYRKQQREAGRTFNGTIPERFREFLEYDEVACRLLVRRGFVEGMRVDGLMFASPELLPQLMEELFAPKSGFVPSITQVARVACLPGTLGYSLGMPDAHSGYGFSIGGVAAMDMDDPKAVVSPGGVGFDIGCGVRLLRTNLHQEDVSELMPALTKELRRLVPVGVGCRATIDFSKAELDDILLNGAQANALREPGLVWDEDIERLEDRGRLERANLTNVSKRARARGLQQIGTLGSGNHYVEVQAVEEIHDVDAARQMGIERVGQICVMIHSGSRGFGHQVATDYCRIVETFQPFVPVPDKQLGCVPIRSAPGQAYLSAMACGANFASANRTVLAHHVRTAFQNTIGQSARRLGMDVIYDVSHNIAKEEMHTVDGREHRVLVHRKGATRAFGPHHPDLPEVYRDVGQPVLIGGSMGTASYVLTGTSEGEGASFASTCHGAGRVLSRGEARRTLTNRQVFTQLRERGVCCEVASRSLIQEEAPGAYKDVDAVVRTCESAGISKLAFKLRPLGVVKG